MLALPLILVSDGVDVDMYRTAEDLLIAVELPDVQNGVFVAYDSEGTLLRLDVEEDRVLLREAAGKARHADALAEILRQYLITIGMPLPLARRYSLPELVSASARYLTQDMRSVSFFHDLWRLARAIFGAKTIKKWTPAGPDVES